MAPIVSDPVCIAPTGDRAGEGAVWHAGHAAVYWTDINRFLIHRFSLADGCVRTWLFDDPVTAITLTDREDVLVVVLGSRVILWEPTTKSRRGLIFQLKDWPRVRLNDARADARGRLWVGSMRNNVNRDGSEMPAGGQDGKLYRIDPDGICTVHRSGIGISNTVTWSPDGNRFYFGDSLANVIWVYDFDADRGTISNERAFFKDFERGIPDGSTVDSEGYLWNCRWDGGCIVRVAPNGLIDCVIEMPVRNITTCTFGGSDLKTLYVTTALGGVPADPLAGGLFEIQTAVTGVPENHFRLAGE